MRVRGCSLAHIQIPSRHEGCEPPLDGPAVEHDVPGACPAPQADVGSEPVDKPLLTSARMGAPQTDDVAEPKLDDFRLARGHYDHSSWRDSIASPITAAQSSRAARTRRRLSIRLRRRLCRHPAG